MPFTLTSMLACLPWDPKSTYFSSNIVKSSLLGQLDSDKLFLSFSIAEERMVSSLLSRFFFFFSGLVFAHCGCKYCHPVKLLCDPLCFDISDLEMKPSWTELSSTWHVLNCFYVVHNYSMCFSGFVHTNLSNFMSVWG